MITERRGQILSISCILVSVVERLVWPMLVVVKRAEGYILCWLLKKESQLCPLYELVCILFCLFPGGKAPRECLGKRPTGIHNP